jgi:hypothetical protein
MLRSLLNANITITATKGTVFSISSGLKYEVVGQRENVNVYGIY